MSSGWKPPNANFLLLLRPGLLFLLKEECLMTIREVIQSSCMMRKWSLNSNRIARGVCKLVTSFDLTTMSPANAFHEVASKSLKNASCIEVPSYLHPQTMSHTYQKSLRKFQKLEFLHYQITTEEFSEEFVNRLLNFSESHD